MQKIKPKKKTVKTYGASTSGFHFYNLYQNCRRKFYIRHVLKIVSKFTFPPFIFGSAFHHGQEVFYNTHSAAKALRACKNELIDRRLEFKENDMYKLNLDRCPKLIERWITERGKIDIERYKLIAVEDNIKLPLDWITFTTKSGRKMHPYINGRIDRIMQDRLTKETHVVDTKTSTFSIRETLNNFYFSEQAVQYLALSRYKYPELGIKSAFCDVAYWNYKSSGDHNIKFCKGDLVYKSDEAIRQYLLGLGDLIVEIAQKVEALKNPEYDPAVLFQRNTSHCYSFYRPCEYADICWSNIKDGVRIAGFKRDRGRKTICDHVNP